VSGKKLEEIQHKVCTWQRRLVLSRSIGPDSQL
jgi:hypothetical protein